MVLGVIVLLPLLKFHLELLELMTLYTIVNREVKFKRIYNVWGKNCIFCGFPRMLLYMIMPYVFICRDC